MWYSVVLVANFVALVGCHLRAWGLNLVLRDGPYKQGVVGLHFERAALGKRVQLGGTLKALAIVVELAPTLEVYQAVALHIELPNPLVGKLLYVVVGSERE